MRTIRIMAAVVVAGAATVVPMAAPAAAGGGCHTVLEGVPSEASGTKVELRGACMVPTVLRVEPGTDVTIVNAEGATHNLYGAGLAVSAIDVGDTTSRRFDHPGTYPYACTLHPGMVGAIVVGDGRLATDVVPVEPVEATGAEAVPLAAAQPIVERSTAADATPLIMLVSVALTLVVGGAGYAFGRRSAELGAHDRADG